MQENLVFDVLVVGFGPCGQLAAAELGRRGHRVLVLERSTDPYPLPRAGHIDDEIVRALQGIGVADRFAEQAVTPSGYQWLDADRRALFTIPWNRETTSTWRSDYIFFQPDVEDLLESAALSNDNVELRRGWEVTSISGDPGAYLVDARQGDRRGGSWTPTGATGRFKTRYVIGADGANSIIRRLAGIEAEDFGFEETLSIVDLRLHDLEQDIAMPDAGQICDPGRPVSLFRWLGRAHCRWEFMLMPGEDPADIVSEQFCWQQLATWGVTPANATIIRRTLYTFRSLIGHSFQSGGLFLIGDAAHLMPPFLGQGMASGMRDVQNLIWKLDLVLRGAAGVPLLDSYTAERRPHVAALTSIAIELGRILCETDPEKAAARDTALRSGSAPQAAAFPALHGPTFADAPGAGELSVQGWVQAGEDTVRAESLHPGRWQVLVRNRRTRDLLTERCGDELRQLGGVLLHVSKASSDGASLVDLDGAYQRQFARLDADVVVVRPDRYIAGSSRAAEAASLLRGVLDRVGLAPAGTAAA